jgi:hypothetical protein
MVPALKSEYPHLNLVVEARSGHAPVLEGFYKNGRRKPIGIKGEEAQNISTLAKLLIDQWVRTVSESC